MATRKPVTPGALLLEKFLRPMKLSQYLVAKEIVVGQRFDATTDAMRESARYSAGKSHSR